MIAHPENKIIPLEEYRVSEDQTPKLKEMISSPEDGALQEFNKRYAIVRTSTTYILIQKTETAFELDSRKSFIHFHENDFFLTSGGKLKNKGIFWLKHPLRRTYEDLYFSKNVILIHAFYIKNVKISNYINKCTVFYCLMLLR